jgi:hypothetical protein
MKLKDWLRANTFTWKAWPGVEGVDLTDISEFAVHLPAKKLQGLK